jgi:glucosylglycerate phosphorylase
MEDLLRHVESDIERHLNSLYGDDGPAVATRVRSLIRRHQEQTSTTSAPRRGLGLSQRDALLITYGDQVREPGTPPLRTLASFLGQHLTGIISGVHVLPFYPSSSDDGFSVIDYYAVDPELGTWSDVEALGKRFDLMFDAVFNHVSAQSDWFQRFLAGDPVYREWFITVQGNPDLSQVVRPRALPLLTVFNTPAGEQKVWTTFSRDQIDLNLRNPDVLLALLDALLFYVRKGARFIRLDAIAYLWKDVGATCIHLPQTHTIIQLMRSVLDAAAPQTMLITETNVPHRDNISYFGVDGHSEAQLVYNFALPPLVIHSIASGSAEALSRWAAELQVPSPDVTFFNFLASHDGIGVNPVRDILTEAEIATLVDRANRHGGYVSYKRNPNGTDSPYELNINYFDALSDPGSDEPLDLQIARFVVAHAIMLALPGMPGIYFHSLFGSRGDRAGAEASGIPRRINRQKLGLAEISSDLADPHSLRARVLEELGALLAQRQASAAFSPAGSHEVLAMDRRVFALRRTSPDGGETVVCLHNVSNEQVATMGLTLGPFQVRWLI